jgi:hypothetical protein
MTACLLAVCLLLMHCKKPFDPPAITAANNYLVVDGIINTGAGVVTTIRVNRTRNLGDSTSGGIPELHATVTIVAGGGATYPLQDTATAGVYTSGFLTLPITQTYKIAITTHDGRKYASDLVPVKQTPLMDSAYYEEPGDFNVYVDTHDPSGNTRYYRWDYVETWEHDAQLMSPWIVQNGLIVPTDSTNQHTQCWTTVNSTNILLGSSQKLSQDVISRAPIIDIPNGDTRINQKYSILVRQYALTADAYAYWSLIQKTSQQLGGLFDLQPTQLTGNIHCLTNPGEPVIGFMSASSVQEQRLFVFQSNLHNWIHNPPQYSCDTIAVPVNQTDYRIYSETDTIWTPYYFVTNGPLVLATRTCVDCLLFGGSNQKPSYWK